MSKYGVVKSSDCLAHYGIKNQKWGVRRFQNEDGTLTEEGKKRYGDTSSMSNQELQEKVNRLRSEQTYASLKTRDINKKKNTINTAARDAAGLISSVTNLGRSGYEYKSMNIQDTFPKKNDGKIAKSKLTPEQRKIYDDIQKTNKNIDIMSKAGNVNQNTVNIAINESDKIVKNMAYKKAIEEVSKMSDKELSNNVQRLLLENQYKELTESKKTGLTDAGHEVVQSLIAATGLATSIITLAYAIKKH